MAKKFLVIREQDTGMEVYRVEVTGKSDRSIE